MVKADSFYKSTLNPGTTWGVTALFLVGLHVALVPLSFHFSFEKSLPEYAIPLLVSIELLAGLIFLSSLRFLCRLGAGRSRLGWMILVGVLLRGLTLPSTPMLEDDYYRYLWDGAVTASGHNPYAWSPADILNGERGGEPIPPDLHYLSLDSGPIIDRINHPHLRTIYPPVAQAFFALAHLLAPFSLFGWRLLLFVVDLAVLLLIVALLKQHGKSRLWAAVYWWNPIVIKEIFNSGHMDVVLLLFLLGALLLAGRKKVIPAAACLGLAVGVKVWPVLLLPLVLKPFLRKPSKLIVALLVFVLIVVPMLLPVLQADLYEDSGFTVYSRTWEMNDALFMVFVWIGRLIRSIAVNVLPHEQVLARLMVMGVLAGLVVLTVKRTDSNLPRGSLTIAAGLFLLSPTQFPWYYVWIIPLLALNPRPSLLLLTASLPLYNLRFYFEDLGRTALFDNGIVWFEYVPIWYLLIREWCLERWGGRKIPSESAV